MKSRLMLSQAVRLVLVGVACLLIGAALFSATQHVSYRHRGVLGGDHGRDRGKSPTDTALCCREALSGRREAASGLALKSDVVAGQPRKLRAAFATIPASAPLPAWPLPPSS